MQLLNQKAAQVLLPIPVLDLAGNASAINFSPSLLLPSFLFHQPHYCWRGLLCLSCPSSNLLWYSCFGAGTFGMQRASKAWGPPLPTLSSWPLAVSFIIIFCIRKRSLILVIPCYSLKKKPCFYVHTVVLLPFLFKEIQEYLLFYLYPAYFGSLQKKKNNQEISSDFNYFF